MGKADEYIDLLAKMAYEAYCGATGWKSAITGAQLPPFEKTPDLVQSAWRAVAEEMLQEIA